ncbi:O-methyltransferase [Pedobacter sp. JY14-1]|uniref:O-methyltransferase n=1 Tax=Pedobacter sp. JY14-1 TaxID=3034151 RepID=UPI0023E1645B|nr:O-methyltransferase [Pedobacter sp. JY14-1]
MSSFEKINYNLRPNKCIERKMMCEAFQRLCFLEHLDKYRYIGFGSAYFTDFSLFHKYLGINDLISIEIEEAKKARFEFNIPYSGIKMHYGRSTTILPNLELEKHSNIVWLDYDDKICEYMFADLDTVVFNCKPGSIFVVSVNVEEIHAAANDLNGKSIKDYRLQDLINRCGNDNVPLEFRNLNFNTRNLGKVSYEMISRQISSTLISRNGDSPGEVSYQQLFHFIYKDNATILTVGGILFTEDQKPDIEKMALEELDYINKSHDAFKISSPNLTYKEVKALDSLLPDKMEFLNGKFKNKKIRQIPLIPNDIIEYAKIYRYYPNYSETNI